MRCVSKNREPLGPRLLTTPEWRELARRKLDELKAAGQTRRQIADAIGCSQGVISHVVNEPPRDETSDIVRPLAAYLGIPAPHVQVTSEVLGRGVEILSELEKLDPEAARKYLLDGEWLLDQIRKYQ